MLEKVLSCIGVSIAVFNMGFICGRYNINNEPKVKLIQMTLTKDGLKENIVKKFYGKEVCVLAANVNNKTKGEDEGVYYCAE